MFTSFRFLIRALALLALLAHWLFAATLHFIMVYDPSPGIGAKADAQHLERFAKVVADMSGMSLNWKLYPRNDRNILEAVRNLAPGSDDVVWFYYSGHGINSGNGWPKFVEPTFEVHQTDVYNKLRGKGARLNLISFDCCNYTQTTQPWARSGGEINPSYSLLFRQVSGTVMMTAAGDGQFAWGNTATGGFFTQSLMRAIGNSSNPNPKAAWEAALAATRTEANQLCTSINRTAQNPKYDVDLRVVAPPGQVLPPGNGNTPEVQVLDNVVRERM